jgi:hypothetical protein
MTERAAELADLYRRHPLEDQKAICRERADEFRRGRNQARIT